MTFVKIDIVSFGMSMLPNVSVVSYSLLLIDYFILQPKTAYDTCYLTSLTK
jgi:hypothetical protein